MPSDPVRMYSLRLGQRRWVSIGVVKFSFSLLALEKTVALMTVAVKRPGLR